MRTVALLSFTRAIRLINKFALPTLVGFSLYPRGMLICPSGIHTIKAIFSEIFKVPEGNL